MDDEHYYQRINYQDADRRQISGIVRQPSLRANQTDPSGRITDPYNNTWLHSKEQQEALANVRKSVGAPGGYLEPIILDRNPNIQFQDNNTSSFQDRPPEVTEHHRSPREGPQVQEVRRGWSPGPSFSATQLWEEQVRKDLTQLCLSGNGATRFQQEKQMLQLQEQTRQGIQNQMERIKELNQSINAEKPEDDVTEDSLEIDDFRNFLASKDPALLSLDYQTRLEMMKSCEKKLQTALDRKSRRLRGLEAQRWNLDHMSRKERSNLQ